MTEKRIFEGTHVELVGGYRGFLKDLTGMRGIVLKTYKIRDEVRYITYVPELDEYIEPTCKHIKIIGKEEYINESVRSDTPSGSVCA